MPSPSKSASLQILFTLIFASVLFPWVCPAQQGGGVAASGSQIRVIRAVVGAKGEQRNGAFVMTEPRSTFYVPEDREVIVYFEWEGTRGVHHCEGSVRGPGGQFATMSSFDYTATQPRFAGFWRVPLAESSPAGSWTFETRVDVEAAGQLAFIIVAAVKPADLPKLKPPPTAAELYSLTRSATVQIEKLDAKGHVLRSASGFFVQPNMIVSSFRAVDGATALRIRVSEGTQLLMPHVIAWNRHQDWVILSTEYQSKTILRLADTESWNVGDHCYWLITKSDGSRILSDGQIVGTQSPRTWGPRIDISGTYDATATGGPLLNDQGDVIGFLGGILPEALLNGFAVADVSELVFSSAGGVAVPSSVLPKTFPPSPVALQELWDRGEMMEPITNSKLILFGMLSQGEKVKGKTFQPRDRSMKVSFQRGDTSASVLVHFANAESFKSVAAIKVYDIDNRLLASGKPEKVNVSRGELAERMWQLPLANLPVGIYRVDVEVGDGVAWRQFFKVTD